MVKSVSRFIGLSAICLIVTLIVPIIQCLQVGNELNSSDRFKRNVGLAGPGSQTISTSTATAKCSTSGSAISPATLSLLFPNLYGPNYGGLSGGSGRSGLNGAFGALPGGSTGGLQGLSGFGGITPQSNGIWGGSTNGGGGGLLGGLLGSTNSGPSLLDGVLGGL